MDDNLMTPVSGIIDQTYYAKETETKANDDLGKDQFLQLLVTQLRYQDPLNPTESAAFSAELAQFTQVEELEKINSNLTSGLEGDAMLTQSLNNTLAATLIGKEVRALGNTIDHKNGEEDVLKFSLQGDAEVTHITIRNSAGVKIDEFTSTSLKAGSQELYWDGKDLEDNSFPDGKFYYEISAESSDGNAVGALPFMTGICTGVRYIQGGAYLVVNGLEVPMSDVSEINYVPEQDSGEDTQGENQSEE